MIVDLDLMSVALELSADEGEGKAARIYEAIIEAQKPFRDALRTIQSAVPKYLKKEMTAEEFALVVIGEVDNKAVFRALEGKAETGRA
jgi:hypothetical protein